MLLRQLQTGSTLAPAMLHVLHPGLYLSGLGQVCKVGAADQWHIWDCVRFPDKAKSRTYPPKLHDAVRSDNKDAKHGAGQ